MAEAEPPAAPAAGSSSATAAAAKKSSRVLACVLCQQRKIKCDRRFPCAHCVKAGTQCVPAGQLPRPRRRRFPERELLDRLRHYESLLRQHNIDFEPMHPPGPTDRASPEDAPIGDRLESGDSPGSDGPASGSRKSRYEPRTIWQALGQKLNISEEHDNEDDYDSDDSDMLPMKKVEAEARSIWDKIHFSSDPLLFGAQKSGASLATLHPDQVQIFKFWQVYLDNVNPLLKVTHIPSLQPRIINAAANVETVDPNLEVLMFAIYCISLMSLDNEACTALFVATKRDLLPVYRFGFQQALVNCQFMRSNDLDVLSALFLYLMSIGTDTDPRSLSSMLGIAVRISRRLGIHSEAANNKCGVLEGEMRRRLWYALIIFDSRISEMSQSRDSTLVPTWDCKPPLNVNDFDLHSEMKSAPSSQAGATEMVFVMVRSYMADFVRHSDYYIDFANPALLPIARQGTSRPSIPDGQVISYMEKVTDEKYLKYCNPENPLHLFTAGIARGYIMKNKILEDYARFLRFPSTQTDADREEGLSRAIAMLECDTQLMTAPQVVGFRWLLNYAFPFAAYIHVIQTLQKQPRMMNSPGAWTAMNDNYEARGMMTQDFSTNPFYKLLGGLILKTWSTFVAARTEEASPSAPKMVVDIEFKTQVESQQTSPANTTNTDATPESGNSAGDTAMSSNDFDISMSPSDLNLDFGVGNDFSDVQAMGTPGMPWPQAGAPPMINPWMANWRALMARNVQFNRGRWEAPVSSTSLPWHQ